MCEKYGIKLTKNNFNTKISPIEFINFFVTFCFYLFFSSILVDSQRIGFPRKKILIVFIKYYNINMKCFGEEEKIHFHGRNYLAF